MLPWHYPHPKHLVLSIHGDIDTSSNPSEKFQNIKDNESPKNGRITPKCIARLTTAHDQSSFDVVLVVGCVILDALCEIR